ncbi:MAG: VanZ family protein [Sedimentisphaerales bacterium]|nr:VanZ family protein [Sedimentisphaerales bacterium]
MALSLQRKITVLVLALYWPAFFISAHVPIPRVVREANVSDKCLHFLAYLILTFLLWFAVLGNRKANWRKAAAWWMLLAIVGYGVVDELLQNLVTGRSCDVRDLFMDAAGTLTGLILCSVFTFYPAALIVTAMFIFGITNVARANVADLFPVAGVLFYLFAYAAFTILWLQSFKPYVSRPGPQRLSIQWIVLALAAPVSLLLTVKLASIVLGRTFIVRDMLISAVGIGAVLAGASFIAGRKIGKVNRSDIP